MARTDKTQELISVGNCPKCRHFPTQFVAVDGGEDYYIHLPNTPHCSVRGPGDRIQELENGIEQIDRVLDSVIRTGQVRYCYECGTIGELPEGKQCCPDHLHAVYVTRQVASQARAGFLAGLDDFEGAGQGGGLTWSLEEDACEALRDFIGDEDVSTVTLSVGWIMDEDSEAKKYGLRCCLSEYPEEGSILLYEMGPPAANEQVFRADQHKPKPRQKVLAWFPGEKDPRVVIYWEDATGHYGTTGSTKATHWMAVPEIAEPDNAD